MSNHVERYGDSAYLITCDGDVLGLLRAIDQQIVCEHEAHVGEASVLLQFDPADRAAEGLPEQLRNLEPVAIKDAPEPVILPAVYDGEDLSEVARSSGLSTDEVVLLHSSATYQVAFCGFMPGFAYLRGLPSELQLPRRDTPRPRVPAGSIAIAAHYCAVYPVDSPGGWHLLGHTDATLFDSSATPPALLVPGATVRFEVQR